MLQVTGHKLNDRRAVSILLVIFIIGSLLTSATLVADVLIRQAKMTKSIEQSEIAVYAAESGMEKVAYEVLKNHCQLASEDCGVDNYLDNGARFVVEDANVVVATATSPWTVSLTEDQAFVIYLDIRGTAYPNNINIAQTLAATDVIVLQEAIVGGDQSETIYTDLSGAGGLDLPISVDASNYLDSYYYKITIRNNSDSAQDYVLSWGGSLPRSLQINDASGTYKTFERVLDGDFPRWQKFSGS